MFSGRQRNIKFEQFAPTGALCPGGNVRETRVPSSTSTPAIPDHRWPIKRRLFWTGCGFEVSDAASLIFRTKVTYHTHYCWAFVSRGKQKREQGCRPFILSASQSLLFFYLSGKKLFLKLRACFNTNNWMIIKKHLPSLISLVFLFFALRFVFQISLLHTNLLKFVLCPKKKFN